MKLNADLVYRALKEKYPVRMMGNKSTEMVISRPELYLDNEVEFHSERLYLATVEHLPLRPKIGSKVVIVVIGEGAKLSHYREHCCLIVIRAKVDFFTVNRFICELFDRYYEWEKSLFDIFLDSADLQQIVDCSIPVFSREILVLDSNFRYLAASRELGAENSLEPELIGTYLANSEMNMEQHGAMLIHLEGRQFLCINLFSEQDIYLGCVYMEDGGRAFTEGEMALAEFMARLLAKAMEKNPSVLSSEQATLKYALMNLVYEYPLTANQKWKLNLSNFDGDWLCISLHTKPSRLPENYLCRAFEKEFSGSFAFSDNSVIVCLLPTAILANGDNYHAVLNQRLRRFLRDTRSIAGVSNSFNDLYYVRIALAQAEAAIENGMITNPETELYYFQSYSLMSMIINSMGNLPAEAYFSRKLQGLIQHDKTAPVSYLDTLRVFLRNSQSYSRTAEELFIHRSTVIDRISRIERELEVDLKDPDTRLQLEMILKAMEIESIVQQSKN